MGSPDCAEYFLIYNKYIFYQKAQSSLLMNAFQPKLQFLNYQEKRCPKNLINIKTRADCNGLQKGG